MIDLNVLGTVEVVGPDGPLHVGGPTQRRLLAVLAVHANSVVANEQLIDALWQGDPPAGVRRSFKAYVARLRSALAEAGAEHAIVTHPAGYSLELDRERLDAHRFEDLVDRARADLDLGEAETAVMVLDEALGLWRGTPFGEFAGESWNEAWSAGLDAAFATAHELRIGALLHSGRHAELLPELEELISRFPYRDQLRELRMRALYRAGRHVDALRELQQYRELLAEEVGVEPGTELADLERRILAHDPELTALGSPRRKLRDFEVGERIGSDELSVVHRGSQLSMGRDIAIRIVRPHVANDPDFIRRFEAEAQRVAALDHPHVATLHDFWREPGAAYVVMRWLDGGTLAERISSHGLLAVDDAVRVLEQIGGALATAHRAGLAHGRLSTDSILLHHDGTASLTDFEMVERAWRDDATERTESCDVRALARVLHDAIAGSPPPSDAGTPGAPAPGIPPELDAVIRRACTHDGGFADVEELVVAARAAVSAEGPGTADVGTADLGRPNPYRGLRAFGEADAADFFGREHIVEQLHERIARSRFVALVGPSGSGKSSIVRAGLIPRVRAAGSYVTVMVPGARPFDELQRALLRISPHATAATVGAPTAEGIERVIRELLPAASDVLLVVDQFEELFTSSEPESRDRFLDALTRVAGDPSNPIHLLVALRADFYDQPLLHPGLGPLVRDNTSAVTPLSADELEAAITQPARRAGVRFETPLVASLLADAVQQPSTLPMLQYALTELYARRTGNTITADDYAAMGGTSGVLTRRAETVLEDLGPALEPAVRRLFDRLVAPGEGLDDTRRRAMIGEFADVPAVVVDSFASARLVTFDRDPSTREPTVEVAHEALLREWPRLRSWIEEDRDTLHALVHLDRAARGWEERGRDADELYRGARLACGVELREEAAHRVGPLATEFLDASADAANAEARRTLRTTRRLRTLLAVATVALVVAVVAGVVAVFQRQAANDRAREAEVGSVLVAANAAVGSDPQLAALLAVEGWRLSGGDDEADVDVLLRALGDDTRRIATLTPRLTGVSELAISGDGTTLAIGNGRSFEVFDLDELASIGPVFDVPSDVVLAGHNLAVNADGSLVGAIIESGADFGGRDAAVLIDPRSGDRTRLAISQSGRNPIFELTPTAAPGSDVLFSPTDDLFVTTDEVASTIWTDNHAVAAPLDDRLIAISGDGRWVASSAGANTVDIRPIDDPATTITVDLLEVGPPDSVFAEAALDHTAQHLVVRWDDEVTIHPVGVDLAPFAARIHRITVDERTSAIAVAPDGRVAVASALGAVQLYSIDSGEPTGRPFEVATGASFELDIAFTRDGALVTAGDVVTVWAAGGGSSLGRVTLRRSIGVALSPDGSLVATASDDCSVHIASAADGTDVARSEIPDTALYMPVGMKFSPDGSMLAAVGGRGTCRPGDPSDAFGTGLIRLIDPFTGDLIGDELVRHESLDATALAWSSDGSSLAVGYATGRVEFLSIPGLERIGEPLELARRAQFVQIVDLALAPDGDTLVAVRMDGTLIGIDTQTRDDRWQHAPTAVWGHVEMLPDGRMITGSFEGAIQLRDATGAPLGPVVDGHDGPILSLAVGGDRMFTGALHSMRQWTIDGLAAIGPAIPAGAGRLDVTPDGATIAVISDESASIWSLAPDDLVRSACKVAGRNLTVDEWTRYLPPGEPYQTTCDQWPVEADAATD
jgi:DNA-binding SARP family transcriptional activator/WD40 repeat protein/energy-coupling factor transporter ATP-binding protein EcfA2